MLTKTEGESRPRCWSDPKENSSVFNGGGLAFDGATVSFSFMEIQIHLTRKERQSLLDHLPAGSPAHGLIQDAVNLEPCTQNSGDHVVFCSEDQAKDILGAAKLCYPSVAPTIEKEIRRSRYSGPPAGGS